VESGGQEEQEKAQTSPVEKLFPVQLSGKIPSYYQNECVKDDLSIKYETYQVANYLMGNRTGKRNSYKDHTSSKILKGVGSILFLKNGLKKL
jgi:hypothetical protein